MSSAESARYATSDPRTIITPDAFSVSGDLVGTPLASPLRRLAAILVDLVFVGLFTLLGWYVLAIAVMLGAFKAAFFRKSDAQAQVYTAFKVVLGCFGTVILFVVIISVAAVFFTPGDNIERALESLDVPESPQGEAGTTGTEGEAALDLGALGLAGVVGGISEIRDLSEASDSAEAHNILVPLVRRLQVANMEEADARLVLSEVGPNDQPWWEGALDAAVAEAQGGFAETPTPASGDEPQESTASEIDPEMTLSEAVAAYEQSGRGDAELSADDRATLQLIILETVSPDTLAELQRQLERSRGETRATRQTLGETEEALEDAQNAGIFSWARIISERMGLLFGWGTVYLTVFTAWWDGRTVGKRLFGIRIVRLDGKPMNSWLAFERAGGYAAGFATGLLGFAQLYWDPNRMTIHDKIAETVVIREGVPKVPGPWDDARTRGGGAGVG